MRIVLALTLVLLTGCASVKSWVPSFWDDNQSAYIIKARLDIEQINCQGNQIEGVQALAMDLRLFELYSQSKGWAQADVLRVVEPMQSTVAEWLRRGQGSSVYCQLKKQILTKQGERAAEVILGRW